MNETKLVALLGRPLTSIESTNLKMYLNIAKERLEDLTCLNLTATTEDRTYDVRQGFQTVFTDPFTEINSVKINGEPFTDYTLRQWNRRNASWYNSIVVDTSEEEVTINADWGMCSSELQLLQAKLFDLVGKMNTGNGNVKSKRVEDFLIAFNDNTVYQQFCLDNQSLIAKYSLCNIADVQHGYARRHDYLEVDYPNHHYRSRVY